jgi:anti-anti-sigma factor
MQVRLNIKEREASMSLSGRFDFDANREFRSGFHTLLNTPGMQSINIDLGGVDYLESSALGMLLIAKERAAARNVHVHLTKCTGRVRQILDIANFGKIFKLS